MQGLWRIGVPTRILKGLRLFKVSALFKGGTYLSIDLGIICAFRKKNQIEEEHCYLPVGLSDLFIFVFKQNYVHYRQFDELKN